MLQPLFKYANSDLYGKTQKGILQFGVNPAAHVTKTVENKRGKKLMWYKRKKCTLNRK